MRSCDCECWNMRDPWRASVGMREVLKLLLAAEHEGSFPRNQSCALSDWGFFFFREQLLLLADPPTPQNPTQGSEPPSCAEFWHLQFKSGEFCGVQGGLWEIPATAAAPSSLPTTGKENRFIGSWPSCCKSPCRRDLVILGGLLNLLFVWRWAKAATGFSNLTVWVLFWFGLYFFFSKHLIY